MKRIILGWVLAAMTLSMGAVYAEAGREGEAYWQSVTAVNLNAEAYRKVMPDRVSANLNAEARASTAVEAQAKVNDQARLVKAAADRVAGVKLITSRYNVYRVNDGWTVNESGKRVRTGKEEWQATQMFTLDGGDSETIQKLAGALQKQGLTLQGFNFYLSREASDKIRTELVGEAVANLKAQAKAMAGYLGESNVRIARLDVNGGGGYQPPMPYAMKAARMEMAQADMANPVAQPDEMEVTVNVNAEVHLR